MRNNGSRLTISALRICAGLLGAYAGLLGAAHGYFEIRQGNVVPDGLMINAMGPPCRPEAVAHACFPALTVVPNMLVTGILAVVFGLATTIWAVGFVQRRRGGPVLMVFSALMLLVGGGFVPMFIGLMAGAAARRIGVSRRAPPRSRFLAGLWPWPLVAYFAWVFPVQWLLGAFFSTLLLRAGWPLFLLLDLGLPGLAVLTAFAHDASASRP
jgi:hypothetical protein